MRVAIGRFWCVLIDGPVVVVAFGFTSRQAIRRAGRKLIVLERIMTGQEDD